MMREVYLDNAAASRLDPRVKAVMAVYFDECGNPGSSHGAGERARSAVVSARVSVARFLNCSPDEVVFTSCGTEANNLAIQGVARANRGRGKHIITTRIEHPSIIRACEYLQEFEDFTVTFLEVDAEGRVLPEVLRAALRDDTVLVSIGYANHEVGSIQPIRELSVLAREGGAFFHTDACQAALLDCDVNLLGVDLLTLNGAKFHGPRGVGALFARSDVSLHPIFHGGGQENGLRSGSENVPAIVGFARALDIVREERGFYVERLTKLRDRLTDGVLKISGAVLNGSRNDRLPGNVNVSFPGLEADALVEFLDEQGVCVSSGSACAAYSVEPSAVLLAMGRSVDLAHASIRFTLGRDTTLDDVEHVLSVLPSLVEKLREVEVRWRRG